MVPSIPSIPPTPPSTQTSQVLFHIFIDEEFEGNYVSTYHGTFSSFEKALEGANDVAREKALQPWELPKRGSVDQDFKPQFQQIYHTTREKLLPLKNTLRICVGLLDTRKPYPVVSSWNYFWLNPHPECLEMLQEDIDSLEEAPKCSRKTLTV